MVTVVPQGMLATVSGTVLGQPWANVHGLRVPEAFLLDQTVVDEIADCFHTLYTSLFGFGVCTTCDATAFVLSDLRTATSPSWDGAWLDFSGGATADPLPPQTAIVASHSTGFRGRSFRGRTYIPGWGENINDTIGQVLAATRAAIPGAFNTFRSDLAAVTNGPVEHAVVSRKLLVATPITSTTVDPEFDRQNRRKRT